MGEPVPKSARDFLQHGTTVIVRLAKLEHIRPQDQIAYTWGLPGVFWIDAASPCDRLNVIRVRNPDAIDASPVAEQFNGLTLGHHFLSAHRENADPMNVFFAFPVPRCPAQLSAGSACALWALAWPPAQPQGMARWEPAVRQAPPCLQ